MELRNLSSTPNQMESVIQRRPSLSSLSSASGYTSSNYGGNNTNGGNTPQLVGQRLSMGSRGTGGASGPWVNQQTGTGPSSNSSASNIGPWVEQQQKQQSTMTSLDEKTIRADLDKVKPQISGSAGSTSEEGGNNGANSSANEDDDDDDELIPTAIVIKNIPFAIKKEQLLDVMTKLNLPLPYAFNYHFDNGVFRGLAFANFTSTDETSMVVNHLNGREIGGRKLRVEYKKMLPLQERERIEREKREKRGQLEEQHRSNSNASLASLMSAASTTAATKNLSVNGSSNNHTTERLHVTLPFNSNSTPPPLELNLNDPETLDMYTQLILYRDDVAKSVFELAISTSGLTISQRKLFSILCSYLGLLELYDNGLIIIRRKPGHIIQGINSQATGGQQQPPSHSSSMMNLNQLNHLNGSSHPELLRSHSQSTLPMPRMRQQASTPIQQHFPQYQSQSAQANQAMGASQSTRPYSFAQSFNLYQSGSQPQHTTPSSAQNGSTANPSSAAAVMRTNNRSYVDIRSTPPLNNSFHSQATVGDSPTPHNHQPPQHTQGLFQNHSLSSSSQPQTPLASNDMNSIFQPFGQHAHLTGSFTSLQQGASTAQLDDFGTSSTNTNGNDSLGNKFSSLNLSSNANYDNATGIWGLK